MRLTYLRGSNPRIDLARGRKLRWEVPYARSEPQHRSTTICDLIVGTSNTINIFGSLMKSEFISFNEHLQIIHIIISNFKSRVDMQKL